MTGKKVFDILSKQQVDLIILDIMIPDCSGFEICRKIRTQSEYFGLPVLFLSSMNGAEEIQHGLAQGADDYLGKPFQIEMLIRRVDMLLAQNPKNTLNDPHTNLLSATGIKRVIQKHLNEKIAFGLIYAELIHITAFIKATSLESREKVVRHFARALNICGEELNSPIFQIGHLGNSHFVIVIETRKAERFAKRANELWEAHLPKLYTDLNLERHYLEAKKNPKKAKVPILHSMLCVTHHPAQVYSTSSLLFESLNHIRQHALESGGSGIHTDRRHARHEAV